jgi:hypothetical protein
MLRTAVSDNSTSYLSLLNSRAPRVYRISLRLSTFRWWLAELLSREVIFWHHFVPSLLGIEILLDDRRFKKLQLLEILDLAMSNLSERPWYLRFKILIGMKHQCLF